MAKSEALEQAFRLFSEAIPDPETTPFEEMRRQDDALWARFDDPAATVVPVDAGGVDALRVTVPGVEPGRLVLWIHGGGYIIGSANGRRGFAAGVAHASGCEVLLPDYRLAPEHPFPAAVDDCLACYRWAVEQFGPDRIVVGGDSAGGGLAFATVLAAREVGDHLPAGIISLSPLTDLTLTGPSHARFVEGEPVVTAKAYERVRDAYLQGRDPRDPLASPLFADFSGFPPMLILVGAEETLLDDAKGAAVAARAAGCDVDLRVYEDMFHFWPLFASILPEGRDTIELIGSYIRERTATSERRVTRSSAASFETDFWKDAAARKTWDQIVPGELRPTIPYTLTRGAIATYCRAVGETNPVYLDEDAALASRHGGLIAPPSIHIMLMFACTPADDWMRSPGTVNAGQCWFYNVPARPGDTITLAARALDKFIKRDRLFVVHDNTFFNQHGDVICSGRGQTIRPL